MGCTTVSLLGGWGSGFVGVSYGHSTFCGADGQ